MLKLLKISLSFIALIIVVLLVIPFFIDANDYKPEINRLVFDSTGRHIEIENIKFSAFPWVGITLHNIRLQNPAGFKQPHILTVKTVDVQLELIPLLNQQLEVKRFNLDTPKIWLEQRDSYSNNWSSSEQPGLLTEIPAQDNYAQVQTTPQITAKTTIPGNKPHQQQNIALNAELLQLKHGQIIWTDESRGELTVSDIELEVHDLQFKQPISLDLSASLGEDSFNIHAKVGPLGDLNTLNFSKLPVLFQLQSKGLSLAPLTPWLPALNSETVEAIGSLEQAKVNLNLSLEQHDDSMLISSGDVQLLMKDTLTGSWKAESKNLAALNIHEFKLGLNDTHLLTLSGKVKHLKEEPRFEVRMETAKLQRLWLNKFLPGLQGFYRNHPEPWQSIKLGTLIAGDADIVEIRDLQLQLDDEPVQISGNLALGDAPDAQLRITANDLHLDRWLPNNRGTRPAANDVTNNLAGGHTQGAAEEPDLTFLKPWYLSVQLNAKSIHINKLKLDYLRMTLSTEKGVVRLNPLSFELGDGHVTENFTLYADKYPATWKESIKVTGVSVSPVLEAFTEFDELTGTAQLSTDLSGKGLTPKNIKRSLNGRGHFVFEDGQFKGVDITNNLRKLKPNASASNRTDFAQMQGNFRINKGVLINNDLYMESPIFRLTGKGRLFLDPLKLDYHVRPRLIDSLAGQGGTQQGIVVPLHISGPLNNLDITVESDNGSLLNSVPSLHETSKNTRRGTVSQGLAGTRDTVAGEPQQQTVEVLQSSLPHSEI